MKEEVFKRYSRQMLIEKWGEEKQSKIHNSTVFIAGAGGLGSPVAIYLAVAGVGRITIADFDSPELTNLNRQILHDSSRIGMNKAISAAKTLSTLNEEIEIIPKQEKITEENIEEIIGHCDIIVDCMDNFQTRFLLNEYAIKKGIPLVHGCVWGLEGRLSFIHVPETPCLQCVFAEAPETTNVFPIVGATAGVIGSLQAIEVLKYLTGVGVNIKNELLVWNGNECDFRRLKLTKNSDCNICNNVTVSSN